MLNKLFLGSVLFLGSIFGQSFIGPNLIVPFGGQPVYWAATRTPIGDINFAPLKMGTGISVISDPVTGILTATAPTSTYIPPTKAQFINGTSPSSTVSGVESYWCMPVGTPTTAFPIYAVSSVFNSSTIPVTNTIFTMMAQPAQGLDKSGTGQTVTITWNWIPSSTNCSNGPAISFNTGSLPTGWVRTSVSVLVVLQ
jgi:hypothetical protein